MDQIAAAVAQNQAWHGYDLRVLMAPSTGYDTVAAKSLLSLVSRDRTERVFVKISSSERLSHFLRDEAEGLGACGALGIGGVPDVLARGSIGGRYFLAQRYIPGPTMHGSRVYLDEAMARTKDWLAKLYEKTRGPPVEPVELVRRAEGYADGASGYFDLGDCVSLMEKLLPQERVPTCRVHGDFWHRNIILGGDGTYATDFAFSAPGEPPIDPLDLICDYDPMIFLDPRQIQKYSRGLPLGEGGTLFLHLYSLLRRVALKVERRVALYDELLLNSLEASMNDIREVGVAKRVVRRYEGEDARKLA